MTKHATIALVVCAAVGAGVAYYAVTRPSVPVPVACTKEARLCPDGTVVGRTGPDCEFQACPSQGGCRADGDCTPGLVCRSGACTEPSGRECGGPGGGCPTGYQCIQDCGPPVAREDDPPPAYRCVADAIANQPRNCPICLASNTMIDTPDGLRNVKDVEVGSIVWSMGPDGGRVAVPVSIVSRTSAPATHQVVHLVLTDGRELWASPDHPTAAGLAVSALRAGDAYDGSTVRSAGLVPYWDDMTYDLLPASESGTYWANGILFGSTLHGSR